MERPVPRKQTTRIAPLMQFAKSAAQIFSDFMDWFHVNVSAYLFVLVVCVFAADLGDWTAFFMIPASLAVFVDLTYTAVIYLKNRTWITFIWECLKSALSGSWAAALLGVEYLKKRWLGQVCLFSTCVHGTGFLCYWVYQHLGTLKDVCEATFTLLIDFIKHLTDPVAIMKAFNAWIKSVFLARYFEVERVYVQGMLRLIREDPAGSLVMIVGMSVVLAGVTLIIYWAYHAPWRRFMTSFGFSEEFLDHFSKCTWTQLARALWTGLYNECCIHAREKKRKDDLEQELEQELEQAAEAAESPADKKEATEPVADKKEFAVPAPRLIATLQGTSDKKST